MFNEKVQGTEASVRVVTPGEAEELWAALGDLITEDLTTYSPDEMVDLGFSVAQLLPLALRSFILDFKRNAPQSDVMLVRGLIPKSVRVPPSVKTSSDLPVGPVAQRAALLLVGITSMMGEPFNYSSLWGGRLVQNMIPVRGKEFEQTSQSSAGTLDWHVEDGFREDRCDYGGLLCLRGDPSAASMYAQARDLRLSSGLEATLRQVRFQLCPDTAHEIEGKVQLRKVAVLSGPRGQPEIVYDTHHITPIDPEDTDAEAALKELHHNLDKMGMSHVMETGDLLIFDNKRVVHARSPFAARYDGTDRWLMRTMICSSAVQYRRWGRRIPD